MTEFESVITRGMTPISEERRERAVLVGVDRPGSTWPLASSLAELERLVDTAGADAVATTTQKLDAPNPRTFVGTGKAEEVAELARAHAADLVVFDDELTPSQQANLEKAMGRDVKVIDRTALILDIFALHATSKEGRLQVRLARTSTCCRACAACGPTWPPTAWAAAWDRASAKARASSRSTAAWCASASRPSSASSSIWPRCAPSSARAVTKAACSRWRWPATRTPASRACSTG